jgi:tellurite resistance protein
VGGGGGITPLWWYEGDIALDFPDAGYEELAEHEKQSRELTIQLGVAVAMSDGELHDTEGYKIKEWITKTLATYLDKPREEAKAAYNKALRHALIEGQKGNLSYQSIARELNKVTEKPQRYTAVELCYDVLAADGTATPEELDTVRLIANSLELDYAEIEKIRDRSIVSLDTGTSGQTDVAAILGIDPEWEPSKAKAHIRQEWQKWNNRVNTLRDGEERENAKNMLDLLAKESQKYE